MPENSKSAWRYSKGGLQVEWTRALPGARPSGALSASKIAPGDFVNHLGAPPHLMAKQKEGPDGTLFYCLVVMGGIEPPTCGL